MSENFSTTAEVITRRLEAVLDGKIVGTWRIGGALHTETWARECAAEHHPTAKARLIETVTIEREVAS